MDVSSNSTDHCSYRVVETVQTFVLKNFIRWSWDLDTGDIFLNYIHPLILKILKLKLWKYEKYKIFDI